MCVVRHAKHDTRHTTHDTRHTTRKSVGAGADVGAALLCVLHLLENQDASAAGDDEAVASLVESARGTLWLVVVLGRERTHAVEHRLRCRGSCQGCGVFCFVALRCVVCVVRVALWCLVLRYAVSCVALRCVEREPAREHAMGAYSELPAVVLASAADSDVALAKLDLLHSDACFRHASA
eukprot:2063879-Rhodomonas_salina.3